MAYNGSSCAGIVTFELYSTADVAQLDYAVESFLAYQSPLWLTLSCKSMLRTYSCGKIYQPYGAFFTDTGEPVTRRYCSDVCDVVMSTCSSFFDLSDKIDFKYPPSSNSSEEGKYRTEKFVSQSCYNTSSSSAQCYDLGTSHIIENKPWCPDPTEVPNEKTEEHSDEVYVRRFHGSECAIACPNTWYKKGTYYLNSYVLYVVSVVSAFLGVVTLIQHAAIIYHSKKKQAPEKTYLLSKRVVYLCSGVSISNIFCVAYLMSDSLVRPYHSMQCIGNTGFAMSNTMCYMQGTLIIFCICWQQAWTTQICADIYAMLQPYDVITKLLHSTQYKYIAQYSTFVHPIVAVIILHTFHYIGNYWETEYSMCGPTFGKSFTGDVLFLVVVWTPAMIIGPICVLFGTAFIFRAMRLQLVTRPKSDSTEIYTERYSERESSPSMVSIDIEQTSMHSNVAAPMKCCDALAMLWKYRRILFLVIASLLTLITAGFFISTILKINDFSQPDFYNCILKENAYHSVDDNEVCGGLGKRTEEAWRIFIIQMYMISFGFLPYIAFGNTHFASRLYASCSSRCGKVRWPWRKSQRAMTLSADVMSPVNSKHLHIG